MVSLLRRLLAVLLFSGLAGAQVNLPSSSEVSGYLNFKNIAAPSSPGTGRTKVWTDSTSKLFCAKNDAGTISCTVSASSAPAHQFFNSLSVGVFGSAQPSFADISSTLGCAQLPTFTGDAANSLCVLTLANTAVTPGSYTNTNLTVDSKGRVTAASSGTGGGVTSVFGRTGVVTAQTGDYSVAQVTGAAPLASPALTGTPTVPTAALGTNTTQAASTAFVQAAIPLTIGFVVNNGVVGNNVGAMVAAPHAGTLSKCKIVTKTSDPSAGLQIRIKQNGTNVFSSNPTVGAGTATGTVSTSTSLTSTPLSVAADDVFQIDIVGGGTLWQFSAQLEN